MRNLSELLFKKTSTAQTSAEALENYHAHGYLGNMYLSLGNLAQAELEYSRAHAIIPSDEVKNKLAVVRKHRSAQSPSTAQPASTTRAA